MKKQTYSELLKNPQWQKKRLEILESHNFQCQSCGDGDSTLNVHHGYYEKGKKPWEYPEESLHCLCEKCHKDYQDFKLRVDKVLGTFHLSFLARTHGYVSALYYSQGELSEIILDNFDMVIGLSDFWRLPPDFIENRCSDQQTITSKKLSRMASVSSCHPCRQS